MKNLILIIILLFPLISQAQESVQLQPENKAIIWSIVDLALYEKHTTASMDNNVLVTDFFEYSTLVTKNRAKYKIELNPTTCRLTIGITDKEYFVAADNKWSPSPFGKIGKAVQRNYITPMAKRIEQISMDRKLLDQLRHQPQFHAINTERQNPPVGNEMPMENSSQQMGPLTMTTTEGVTIKVTSSRIIGDHLVISGQLTCHPSHHISLVKTKIITSHGMSIPLSSSHLGGKTTNNTDLYDNIPIAFDFIFPTNDEPIINVPIMQGRFQYLCEFKFSNLPVPFPKNETISKSCLEVKKDVYLTFMKEDDINHDVKIFFSLINKSPMQEPVTFRNLIAIDKNGIKHEQSTIHLAGNEQNSIELTPNLPVEGYFEFPDFDYAMMRMLEFETKAARFTLQDIAYQQNQ